MAKFELVFALFFMQITQLFLVEILIVCKKVILKESVTGILNPYTEIGLQLYPNPAQEQVTVELTEEFLGQNYNLEIYNLNGDLILKESLNDNKKQSVDLTDVVSGHYVVVIRTAEKLFTYRLIKE